jgi:hypothetical protein
VSRNLLVQRVGAPLALGAVFLAVTGSAPAYAYLDPGTGSMMLQLMLGGVAGALVIGKLYLHRARDFFRSIGRRRPPQ